MQYRFFKMTGMVVGGVLLVCLLLAGIVWFYPDRLNMSSAHRQQFLGLAAVCVGVFGIFLLLLGYQAWASKLGRSFYNDRIEAHPVEGAFAGVEVRPVRNAIRDSLRDLYGPLWRRKTRLLLLTGEPAEVEAIAPGLTQQRWLVGERTVLFWAGSLHQDTDPADLQLWRSLSRWRGFDGLVWALTGAQSLDESAMGVAQGRLRELARDLRWQLPLYVWHVCDSGWPQPGRESEPVGCLLPAKASAADLEHELTALLEPLRVRGMEQINGNMYHDFLFRLSRDLQAGGIARWCSQLAPWLTQSVPGVPLRGLWFSLAFAPRDNERLGHHWLADKAWQDVIDDRTRSLRVGWPAPRIAYAALLGGALLWSVGMALSFNHNRSQITQVQAALSTLQQAGQGDAQVLALYELVSELSRLDYRAREGAPWYQRFGLNHNDELLAALWPRYVEAHARLLRDPAEARLRAELDALVRLAPDSPERTRRAGVAYDRLKAWLMMARPEKADAAFLVRVMGELEPQRAGISQGVWRELTPRLWQFYGEHLEAHPAVSLDPLLLGQVRKVLIGQLGQRNADASLYRQVLDSAASHYPDLTLAQMLGDTDGSLFDTARSVPGVFTRQAWEGQVREAIERIAEARREEIDWVLSDTHHDIADDLAPDVLRERLTARYFQDYSDAWLGFLNSLRWQRAGSLSEAIDQLTLMSDVRQSPLIALMDTLAWQGRAGSRQQALADSLLQSAQQLIGQDKAPLVGQLAAHLENPLDETFGPLLAVLGKEPQSQNPSLGDDDRLSLQAFLTRVTRVRLKLQQISNAADPQAMTQALAQTVFRGNNVDLADTRAYGSLLAASLGAEWGTVGETLFVQPLDEAWQRVLQPSAASLNRQWQRAVVDEWQRAFVGRYPFASTDSEASLPMLGQMIRADAGRIDRFLHSQLGGVLRKEGSRWVADPQHSQGLRFNPKFLEAVNQLGHLADVLYTDGGMGLSFELRGKPVRNIAETVFILDGEKHQYFNQRERWQRFTWPGGSDHPGARVSWTSVVTAERLYGDYQGTWGLIRLLENAQVTLLDDGNSRYHLELPAPDGLKLTWHLRTELGEGPLALLRLRGFELPKQIFLDERADAETTSQSL